jgi:archaellin
MNKLIIILILILIIYTSCYFIFNEEISILQLKKNKLKIENLLSKQPIIIEDNIDNKFIKETFKYNIISEYKAKKIWERTNYKYTIIYSLKDTTIFISNPKELKTKIPNKKDIIIEIKLKKGRSIIIPFKWYYSLENKNYVRIYGIDDYITYIFGTIF